MINRPDFNEDKIEKYSIGAVVKLTGLTSHNIRVWERRHNAVIAERLDSGRRFYTQAQVNRLILLKRCITCGFSISELASLSDSELQEKIEQSIPKRGVPIDRDQQPTIVILGQSVLTAQVEKMPKIDILFSETLTDFSKVHMHDRVLQANPDILVLEVTGINSNNVSPICELIKATSPILSIVIYRFGNQTNLSSLRNQGVRLLRAPLDDEALFFLLSGFVANRPQEKKDHAIYLPNHYPSHLYNDRQLATIADLPTKVECECPHHLVDLIQGLKSFERYSSECINKNSDDAALHGKIQLTTATVRQNLELLLEEVLEIEGIDIG